MMNNSRNRNHLMLHLIRTCICYDLSEKQSLRLISHVLSKNISTSGYYKYKKKLYEDEKFQSLKKSIYNSKLLKCLLLYLEDLEEPHGSNPENFVFEQFPFKKNIFQISEIQYEKISKFNTKIRSDFLLTRNNSEKFRSNLARVNDLPIKYTLREEYVTCGKNKSNKCKSCPHGPYYYAYWKDKSDESAKGLLRKKYLGTIDPRL